MTVRGKTSVRFASGMDGAFARPAQARHAGFDKRFAVIQDTHVPGQDDMVFDEALWRALAGFVAGLGQEARVVDRAGKVARPQSLESWMAAFAAAGPDDRRPPDFVLAHDGDVLKACMVTEFWCNVGGPAPYHDSYTYSLYSAEALGPRVLAHLQALNGQGQWALSEDIILVSAGASPGIVKRILDWLR